MTVRFGPSVPVARLRCGGWWITGRFGGVERGCQFTRASGGYQVIAVRNEAAKEDVRIHLCTVWPGNRTQVRIDTHLCKIARVLVWGEDSPEPDDGSKIDDTLDTILKTTPTGRWDSVALLIVPKTSLPSIPHDAAPPIRPRVRARAARSISLVSPVNVAESLPADRVTSTADSTRSPARDRAQKPDPT